MIHQKKTKIKQNLFRYKLWTGFILVALWIGGCAGVWSKNSSSLAISKTRKFFNPVEFVEGIRDRWRCDRFVIENFAIDRIYRIYRLNRIGKPLAFS